MESQLVLLVNKLVNFVHWGQVHEIPRIHSNIYPKFLVAAQITSAHVTAVLDIVNH